MRLNTAPRRKEELPDWLREMDHFRPTQEKEAKNDCSSPPTPVQVKAGNGQTLGLFFGWRFHFSNFHPAQFELDGHTWTCTEHFYVHEKLHHFGKHELARDLVVSPTTARDMKLLGGEVELAASEGERAEWTRCKVGVMKRCVQAKFEQSAELAEALLSTRDWELVEASPTDKFWGSGLSLEQVERHARVAEWRLAGGRNMLGNVLMWVRSELKEARGAGTVAVRMPKQLVGARPITELPLQRRDASSSSSSSFSPGVEDQDHIAPAAQNCLDEDPIRNSLHASGLHSTALDTDGFDETGKRMMPHRHLATTDGKERGRGATETTTKAAQVWEIDEDAGCGDLVPTLLEPKAPLVDRERAVKHGEMKVRFDQRQLPDHGFKNAEVEEDEGRPFVGDTPPARAGIDSLRENRLARSMPALPSSRGGTSDSLLSPSDAGGERGAPGERWIRGLVPTPEPKPIFVGTEGVVDRGERKTDFGQYRPMNRVFKMAIDEEDEERPFVVMDSPIVGANVESRYARPPAALSSSKGAIGSPVSPINPAAHSTGKERGAQDEAGRWSRRYGMVSRVLPRRESVTDAGIDGSGPIQTAQRWGEPARIEKGHKLSTSTTHKYPRSSRLPSTNAPDGPSLEGDLSGDGNEKEDGKEGDMEAMIASFSSAIRVAKKGKAKNVPQQGFCAPGEGEGDAEADGSGFCQSSRTYFSGSGGDARDKGN